MDLYHLHEQAPTYTSHLTSLFMRNHPFTTTLFHPLATDARIFLSARRRYFHVWNLASGQIETVTRMYGQADEQRSMEKFKISPTGAYLAFIGSARKGGGVINFLDANTLQWIAQARIESRGGIADFAWWRNGSGITVAGKNGEITEFSLDSRRVVARWRDEGAVGTTTLALGGKSKSAKSVGGDAYVAIGSSAGIVNVYSRASWFNEPVTAPVATSTKPSSKAISKKKSSQSLKAATKTSVESADDTNAGIPAQPSPLRALDQLTTPISHLAFSPDGQVLCMASRWKKDALRLVHMPSCTVYRNWPTAGTPLGRISAVCFGVTGAGETDGEGVLKLVVGNEAGRIAAWDIRGE
jgi:U3 small nucleolar RNA-associated protein 18